MPEFRALQPQSPINPLADAYGEEALRLSAAVARDSRCVLHVPYGAHAEQHLDIYLPAETHHRDMPVMIFFHGGGFTHGYKEWCGVNAPPLVKHPAILVAPDYRLMPAARYPEAIEDAVAAVRWVHHHIAEFGGSPDRIFVGGHSAGALLAALLAVDHDRLRDGGVDPAVVKAACCISGTFNRDGMTGQMGYDVPPGPIAVEPRSPIALAHQARVPLFLAWGGRERQRERVERSTLQLINAVRDAGQPVEWLFVPDADHFSIHLDTGRDDSAWAGTVRGWFEGLPRDVMAGSQNNLAAIEILD
jgi:arylformamidase